MGVWEGVGIWSALCKHTCACMHACMYACMHAHTHAHACMHTHMHMHVKHDKQGCLYGGGHLQLLNMQ